MPSLRTAHLPYLAARWALALAAGGTGVAAGVFLRFKLHSPTNPEYGTVFVGLLLFAFFVGLVDLGWWGFLGLKTWAEQARNVAPAPARRRPSPHPVRVHSAAVATARVPAHSQAIEPVWDGERPTVRFEAGSGEVVVAPPRPAVEVHTPAVPAPRRWPVVWVVALVRLIWPPYRRAGDVVTAFEIGRRFGARRAGARS